MIYEKGCIQAGEEWMERNLLAIASGAVGTAFAQVGTHASHYRTHYFKYGPPTHRRHPRGKKFFGSPRVIVINTLSHHARFTWLTHVNELNAIPVKPPGLNNAVAPRHEFRNVCRGRILGRSRIIRGHPSTTLRDIRRRRSSQIRLEWNGKLKIPK